MGALDMWHLDAFRLDAVTEHHPLRAIACHLFEHTGLIKHFNLDCARLVRFFDKIEGGYGSAIPYHNSMHAASVTHGMYALLEVGGLVEVLAPALGKDAHLLRMACLLAAAVHDYEHLGLKNDFLVETMHERALQYNDQHVNEHHHAAAALAVLSQPECSFLDQLPRDDFRWVRTVVIKLVLGTDTAMHRDSMTALLDLVANGATGALSEQQAWVLLQSAMKCADLGHLALGWEDHMQWTLRLEEELLSQGDREKGLGLPVSFLADREKPSVSKTQVGFFDNVAMPFFRAFASAVPTAEPLLACVEANRERWLQLKQGAVAEAAPTRKAQAPSSSKA